GELMPLLAARRARKDFLDKIGRFLGACLAAQEMKKRRAMRAIGRLQILVPLGPLPALRGPVRRMHMARRRWRKGMTRRRTVAAGAGRQGGSPGRHERKHPVVAGLALPVLCRRLVARAGPWSGWAAGPVRDWRV